jgi:hypothetical protein
MKKLIAGLSAACGAALLTASVPNAIGAQAQGQALVIQGGTLIDGNGGAPVPNSVIVVQGNRITAVGRAGQVQTPAGAQVVNAAGKWVLPGLMDAKANWNWQYGEGFLHYGVTSAFVSGPRNDLGLAERDAILHGVFPGPRLFQSIIGIRGPGRDGMKQENFIPGSFNRIGRTSEETAAQAKAYLENGGDFITFVDGDGAPEVFERAVKETLAANKAVVFRAMGPQTRALQVCAMGSGIVYIHTGNVSAQIATDEAKYANYIALPPDPYADMDDAKANAAIQKLVACNAYLEPDLMAASRGFHKNWARVQREDREVFSDPEMLAYYPRHSIVDLWENVQSPEDYLTPQQIAVRKAGFAKQAVFLKRYVDAGGKIVAASDITQSAPGLGLHQEMTAFVEDIGLTPMQAIQSATKWVAEGFKQPDLGVIAPGKIADIIVVDADPLQNILNLRKVSTVVWDGKVIDHGYHSWYAGGMFSLKETDDDPIVGGAAWAAALKQATFRPGGGGNVNVQGAAAPPPPVPAPNLSPTPGIESISLHTIIQGSPDTVLNVKGFNFVRGTRATYDDMPVPTRVISRTELEMTIPQNLLARAGKFVIQVKNPEPLATPDWGAVSNKAYMLVPFSFTTKWSHNRY